MKRTEREGLQAFSLPRIAVGRTWNLLTILGGDRPAAIGGAEDGGERPSLAACPSDALPQAATYCTSRELEAELHALEGQHRTELPDELGAGRS